MGDRNRASARCGNLDIPPNPPKTNTTTATYESLLDADSVTFGARHPCISVVPGVRRYWNHLPRRRFRSVSRCVRVNHTHLEVHAVQRCVRGLRDGHVLHLPWGWRGRASASSTVLHPAYGIHSVGDADVALHVRQLPLRALKPVPSHHTVPAHLHRAQRWHVDVLSHPRDMA